MAGEKQIIEGLVREKTLGAFHVGCDPFNFELLEHLAAHGDVSVRNLGEIFDRKVTPINRRVNILAEAGIVERFDSKRMVRITELGNALIGVVSSLQKMFMKNNYKSLIEAMGTKR